MAATMTPPPSTQVESTKSVQPDQGTKLTPCLASPPPTLRPSPPISKGTLYGEVPNTESIEKMSEVDLRQLVSELLPALGEARVAAAHSKLQHSLLSIEKDESLKRAEVEHEATRREVQVLQESSPISTGRPSSIDHPNASLQNSLHLALTHCRELQQENAILDKRLRASRRLIAKLDCRNFDLQDHITMLRQRIRDNRDHLNELQEANAIGSHSMAANDTINRPRTTPRTPARNHLSVTSKVPQRIVHSPFFALLQASNAMNIEPTSVPPKPDSRRQRPLHQTHARGAHSLSSMPNFLSSRGSALDLPFSSAHKQPSTIQQKSNFTNQRPASSDEHLQRHDRESTISASEDEVEIHSDSAKKEPSSASQAAANLLGRKLSQPFGGATAQRQNLGRSSIQTRIDARVIKPQLTAQNSICSNSRKRALSEETSDIERERKLIRVATLSPAPEIL